jgi:hypothetical protein
MSIANKHLVGSTLLDEQKIGEREHELGLPPLAAPAAPIGGEDHRTAEEILATHLQNRRVRLAQVEHRIANGLPYEGGPKDAA